MNVGDIYGAEVSAESDGLHAKVLGGEDTCEGRFASFSDAEAFVDGIAPVLSWVAEGRRERAAFNAASPAERALVMGMDTAHGEDTFSRRWDLLVEQA